jgi:hypothetical protein
MHNNLSNLPKKVPKIIHKISNKTTHSRVPKLMHKISNKTNSFFIIYFQKLNTKFSTQQLIHMCTKSICVQNQ